ncbi:ABC transporter ATP-binding protein [Streptomonospora litoralis]|uniref:Oligopeptide transport ATP-binding protein OppD n=1 Tax=Streptomonospora litoralis TaxID=2498135 RepID=A0A4P6Q0Y6_9ACTN|nr:ABC transporter ATP-binding protein [Streptomonospora litoralis]QBI53730.1 Oligopeptide transport ATP-binding protein OppD [Streptomonospora litoralis]
MNEPDERDERDTGEQAAPDADRNARGPVGEAAGAGGGGPGPGEYLQVADLSVTYRTAGGDVPAVRGVSFGLQPGSKLGVAGESGCGKSTVALALLRLLPRTARTGGRVLLDGEDVLAMRWGRLRAVRWAGASIVFQGAMHSLNPVHRVGAQIAEPVLLHGGAKPARARERVAELLEQVGLPAWRSRSYPHELSGGQRQRAVIAMALACEPRLIIADEPTTALDVMIQAQILRLIDDLVTGLDISMLMISHDLSVLADTCDRLAVMYAGRIVEEGPAEEVFAGARHPYSAALSAAFPRVGDPASRRAPRGLPGDPPDPAALPRGCSFGPRCPEAQQRCAEVDPVLWPAGGRRSAACVRVLSDEGARAAGVPPARPREEGAADTSRLDRGGEDDRAPAPDSAPQPEETR